MLYPVELQARKRVGCDLDYNEFLTECGERQNPMMGRFEQEAAKRGDFGLAQTYDDCLTRECHDSGVKCLG